MKEAPVKPSSYQGLKAHIHLEGPLKKSVIFPDLEHGRQLKIQQMVTTETFLLKREGYTIHVDGRTEYLPSLLVIARFRNGVVIEAWEAETGPQHKNVYLRLMRKMAEVT